MKTFKINTIQDRDGNKIVLTSESGESKVWDGRFYDFEREIVQVSRIAVTEVEADTFQHAIDKIRFEKEIKDANQNARDLRFQLNLFQDKVIKRFGKKLRGLKRESKLNSFLR